MNDAENESIIEALEAHLRYATARLHYDRKSRDTLVSELAEAEQIEGSAPVDLSEALERAEQTVLARETEVLEAEYNLLSARDRQIVAAQSDENNG